MIELTHEQQQALANPNPVMIDPRTQEAYVLVRKDTFDRMKGLLYDDGDLTHDDLRQLLARSAQANGWNEPGMEAYDNYDEHMK